LGLTHFTVVYVSAV